MSWFTVQAHSTPVANVAIEGEIRAGDARAFLSAIPSGARAIHLRVTSPGGDPDAALQIAAGLRAHPATVQVTIPQLAASAATLPVMAGDRVQIARGAAVMLHNPSLVPEAARLDARMLREAASALDRVKARMVDAYAWRMRPSPAELARLMDDTTWLDAEGAIRVGLADEVIAAAPAVTACLDAAAMAQLGPVPARFAALVAGLSRPGGTSAAEQALSPREIYRRLNAEYHRLHGFVVPR